MARKIQDLTHEELQKLREQMLAMGVPLANVKDLTIEPDEE